MKEIKAYQTSDGAVWEDMEVAREKQDEIDIKERLTLFWDLYTAYGELSLRDVIDASFEKRKILIDILLNK